MPDKNDSTSIVLKPRDYSDVVWLPAKTVSDSF